ncbi:MAG TPA: hypothetical protein VGL22_08840 [Terracidiphilus sp.]
MMTPRILSIAAVLLFSDAVALTQISPERAAARPRFEVSGGFAMAAGGILGTGKGFNAGVDARAHGPLYIAAETSWLSDTHEASNGTSDTAILAGPRYRMGGATAVFADFLAGADIFRNTGQAYTHNYNDATNFALAADVGADVALGRRFSVRPLGGILLYPPH